MVFIYSFSILHCSVDGVLIPNSNLMLALTVVPVIEKRQEGGTFYYFQISFCTGKWKLMLSVTHRKSDLANKCDRAR